VREPEQTSSIAKKLDREKAKPLASGRFRMRQPAISLRTSARRCHEVSEIISNAHWPFSRRPRTAYQYPAWRCVEDHLEAIANLRASVATVN